LLTLGEERRLRVFENGVMRKIFGSKTEELHGPYSSPNIVCVIKRRRKRWVGKLACVEDKRSTLRVLVGRPEEKKHLEDLGLDWGIILK